MSVSWCFLVAGLSGPATLFGPNVIASVVSAARIVSGSQPHRSRFPLRLS